MGDLGDKRLRDFVPTIDAYRPVALTVAAILGLIVVLPGASGGADDRADRFGDFDEGGDGSGDLSTAPIAAGGGEPEVAAPPAAGSALPAPGGGPVAPSVGPVGSPSPGGARRSPAPAPAGTSDAVPSPPRAASGPLGSSGSPSASEPLQIAGSGWASATGGAPVPTAEAERIPEGTLPIGNRLGQADKVAFVRLSGEGTTLVLAEDASGRRGGPFEVAPVQLCQITEQGWEEGGGQAMADAPAHDPESCAPGQQRADGTWAFSLAGFADPADARGFAIVATPDAPIDFQITYAGQAVS